MKRHLGVALFIAQTHVLRNIINYSSEKRDYDNIQRSREGTFEDTDTALFNACSRTVPTELGSTKNAVLRHCASRCMPLYRIWLRADGRVSQFVSLLQQEQPFLSLADHM